MPNNPRMRGTRTSDEVQGNWTPPQVRPRTVAEELALMMRMPLVERDEL